MKKRITLVFLVLLAGFFVWACRSAPILPARPGTVPIVFHPDYDIGFFGLEKLHPFDSAKYGRIHARLVAEAGFAEKDYSLPTEVSEEDLLLVHTEDYLASLKKSSVVAKITELAPLAAMPAPMVDKNLLRPKRLATGGTILAAELALEHGWAINLSGGYHHAKPGNGEGFCVFADIPIAMEKLWKESPKLRALVIDLDAHQGNGLEACFEDDPRVHIVDLYNSEIYPGDEEVKKFIRTDLPVESWTGDEDYLALLKKHLGPAFDAAKPDIVFYNAGTDIFEKDPLGALSITAEGITKRDELVWREALSREVPIVMVPSGGYTMESAGLVADSILNLLELEGVKE